MGLNCIPTFAFPWNPWVRHDRNWNVVFPGNIKYSIKLGTKTLCCVFFFVFFFKVPDWTREARDTKRGSTPHKWDTGAGEKPAAAATTPGWSLWTLNRGGELTEQLLLSLMPWTCYMWSDGKDSHVNNLWEFTSSGQMYDYRAGYMTIKTVWWQYNTTSVKFWLN